MGTWAIYHKDGSVLADANGKAIVVHALEYSDTWMGSCYVSVTIENECLVEFAIGDYLEYRGERFEINYDPGKIKTSSANTYGAAFKYDAVKFNSLSDELARCEFLDVVLSDNSLHYTALPKFSFYVSSLDDLLDRILANLNEQIGENEWKLYSRNKAKSLQRGCSEEEWNEMYGEGTADNAIESKSVTIDQKTCWEALALVNSEWDVNFIVRGRNIYVGTAGIPTSNIFKYGKGKGLYEVEQNADDSQSVITRLRAYGSDQNLPDHYYADLGKTYYSKATLKASGTTASGDSYAVIELTGLLWPSLVATYFYEEAKDISEVDGAYKVKIKTETASVTGIVWGTAGNAATFKAQSSWYEEPSSDIETLVSELGTTGQVYFVSGVNVGNLPDDNKIITYDSLPNNMACDRLMLPGFPHQTLQEYWDSLTDAEKEYVNPSGKEHRFSTNRYRPYIDSLNIDEIGMRQGSVYFDTDDEANGIIEIYPSMEEMTTSTGQRVDEIYEGSGITDDGRFEDGQTVPNFTIKLRPEIDFDINDLKQEDFSIHFQDGMCGGRDFSVQASVKGTDGCWKLTLSRQKDDALKIYFPYKDYQINAGDHFVLTGIELPESYVKAASLKLLKWAIAYLDENDYTRYVYQPKIDEIYMARQHDEYLSGSTTETKSLYLTLKAGDLLSFKDSDLGIEGEVCIDTLSIKEADGAIPTYEVTLRDDKEVGTIQKIQNQISSLATANGSGSGGGLTATQTKSLIKKEGENYFISKTHNDTAEGDITFKKDVNVGGTVTVGGEVVIGKGLDVGGSMEVSDIAQFDDEVRIDGNLTVRSSASIAKDLTTKNLTVTGQAHFFELVIDKIKAAGGSYIFSAANSFNVLRVAEGTNVLRLYWLAESGGSGSMNTWEVGDQAVSMDFNRAKVGTTYEVSNKYWWALVTATSGNTPESITEDGVTHDYHWIEVSTTDCAEGCTVTAEVGDAVAQWGSRSDDPKRQGAIMICAYKSPDAGVEAPCFVEYTGINSFTITEANRKNKIAYDGTVLKGSFTAISEKVGDRDITEWLESLQTDADTHFDIWYGDEAPTLENEPAVEWTTDSRKAEHEGDLYFDRSDTAKSDGGHCYRFTATTTDDTTTYAWEDYTDQDTLKALTKAQNIADDGIISAGTEKAQLLVTIHSMTSEYGSFSEPTSNSSAAYSSAYNAYKEAYENFINATQDIVSEANIGKDTKLEDVKVDGVSLTPETYAALYYNYYAKLSTMRLANEGDIKASISTIDGTVKASVTKNDLQIAGLTIEGTTEENGHITLDAAKTTVTGDLTVQGAITDSTSYVGMDGTWYAPNDVGELTKQTDKLNIDGIDALFVPIDMTTIKSVQIQTTDPSKVLDGTPETSVSALVALPMYEDVDLGNGTTIPAYKRSGTHVLIRNAFSLTFTQWSESKTGWSDAALRRNIEAAAVYVCTDPRLLALSNYAGDAPTIPADGREVNGGFNTANFFKGCMYKDGRRGRCLALLPGQQVELVSAVSMWQEGTNDPVPYLVWYVVGSEGLTSIEKTLKVTPTGTGYTTYDATFVAGVTGGEGMGVGDDSKYCDAFFAPSQMGDTDTLTETLQLTLGADFKPYITIG